MYATSFSSIKDPFNISVVLTAFVRARLQQQPVVALSKIYIKLLLVGTCSWIVMSLYISNHSTCLHTQTIQNTAALQYTALYTWPEYITGHHILCM